MFLLLHRVIPGWRIRWLVAGPGFEPGTFGL
jgi:hypothetical protein